MKYTAINIGPIISTFSMARKPRELWAASYMFSHLMKCIYSEAENNGEVISPSKPNPKKDKCIDSEAENCGNVISPSKPDDNLSKVGIYPDRIYIKGEINADDITKNAFLQFYFDLLGNKPRNENNPDLEYFNIMVASCEASRESEAISILNQKLDILELNNQATDRDAAKSISDIIKKKKFSSLFQLATGKDRFPIPELEEIAKRELTEHPELKKKSHHKYFCVVQADGDNVGKTVSHQDLQDGQVGKISTALVDFGLKAAEIIEGFGGLPIYAGGDDLLFIAPVIGKDKTNILDLLNKIETEAFGGVAYIVKNLKLHKYNDDGKKTKELIEASLSFGISISYYKYPLYEAFESARNLLFGTAKNIKDKKAIAWSFRKHSGGIFNAAFSLKNESLQTAFQNLIQNTDENTIVSAVAHKIRQEEVLVNTVMKSEKDIPYSVKKDDPIPERPRLDALFDKVLEFQDNAYFKAVKNIMPILYEEVGEKQFISTLYSLLRTAKFIKGEDLHDEE